MTDELVKNLDDKVDIALNLKSTGVTKAVIWTERAGFRAEHNLR